MEMAMGILMLIILFISILNLMCSTDVYSRMKELQKRTRKIQNQLDMLGVEDGDPAD